jgi:hypothetical protein
MRYKLLKNCAVGREGDVVESEKALSPQGWRIKTQTQYGPVWRWIPIEYFEEVVDGRS